MVNDEFVNHQQEPLPASRVYCPAQHMTNLNLGAYEPSSDIFHNPYGQIQGSLKERDKFRTKEDCIRAIKKYHMELSVDCRVDQTNATRYKIYYHNEPYLFRLLAFYQKRSDSWEIGSMSPFHTCLITNPMQDHRKLSFQLICDEILFVISDNPLFKVSIIISHIVTQYNYTLS